MIPPWPLLLAGSLWLAAVGWGFTLAVAYQARAGEPASPGSAWPARAPFRPDPLRPTLVLAAHPQCPCTRATLRELDRLLARCRERLSVHVLFYADPALGADWVQSDLWRYACSIPGVEVQADPLGETLALFGAHTSGQAFLFRPDGELVFEGGLTAARAHEGDSAGTEAVAEFVARGRVPSAHAPVFGCAFDSAASAELGP